MNSISIMSRLNAMLYLVWIEFRVRMAYRNRVLFGILQSIFALFAFVFVWKALKDAGLVQQASLESLITYSVLSTFINAALPTELIARKFEMDVASGDVSNKILRPLSISSIAVATSLGALLSFMMISILPVALSALLIQNILFPKDFVTLFVFFILMLFGIVISIQLDLLAGYLCFWIFQGRYVRHFFEAITTAFSGRFVPLALLPAWFITLSTWFPMRFIYYDPISVFSGLILPAEYGGVLLRSLSWVCILSLFLVILNIRAMRKIFVQGG